MDRVKQLVFEKCKKLNVPSTAEEPLIWVIINHWTVRGSEDFFKYRAPLLTNPSPTTLVVKEVFEEIEQNPSRYYD